MASDEPAQLLTRDDTYRRLSEEPPPGGSLDDPARMIGNGAVSAPNIERVDLAFDEMLVLCSDGVHKYVDAVKSAGCCASPRRSPGAACAWSKLRARTAARTTRRYWSCSGTRPDPVGALREGGPVRAGSASLLLMWPDASTSWQPGSPLAAILAHSTGVRAMTPEQIDRVFGRGRLRMVTGEHVEVFREAARAGDRRRYTKRFLNTPDADFGQWTEREWRILARLIGHGIDCVPEVVQFDRGEPGGTKLVQTYDAGATVDQWATLLPVSRESRLLRHVFEDCAHWWALAHHCLRALFAIHELSVVHLDIKGDNVCIPVGPPGFDPDRAGLHLYPRFAELALIDFAFALVSRESLTTALPIGWQTDYDYQSPRLLSALEAGRRGNLQPTRELDWRCDMYSLAAMLKRYLPDDDAVLESGLACGWSLSRARRREGADPRAA